MQLARLSERAIALMPVGSERVRDHRLPIIAVPAKAKQRVSLYVIKRFKGQRSASWLKLGVWPEISWSVAKDKALTILAAHANDKTPTDAKDEAEHTLVTTGDVLRYALMRIDADKKMSRDRTRNLRSIINTHLLPALDDLPFSALTVDVIYSQLIAPRYDAYKLSYIALMLRTLRQSFRLAKHRIDERGLPPMSLQNYTSARVTQKEAAYHVGQVDDVIARIKDEPKPWLRMMAAWCLMYGVRVGEAAALSWSEHIDIRNQMYRIPASLAKNKKAHRLPLTSLALDVLTAYRRSERARGRRGDKMFPARRNPWRAINPSYASDRVSMMLMRGSGHDLRKLMRSWLQENCGDTYVGRLILNQKQDVLDDVYVQKLLEDKSRAHLEIWHARLIEAGLLEALAL